MSELVIRRMTADDIDGVMNVERQAFSVPWSRNAFQAELTDNDLAHYLVLVQAGQIVGYAGMWLILDEAHVTNIAVLPACRRIGLGEKLLVNLIHHAKDSGAVCMTLEVRATNTAAQNLYKKLGFEQRGLRRGYYTDTKEDALIMWCEAL